MHMQSPAAAIYRQGWGGGAEEKAHNQQYLLSGLSMGPLQILGERVPQSPPGTPPMAVTGFIIYESAK